jgi:hypothetical protein
VGRSSKISPLLLVLRSDEISDDHGYCNVDESSATSPRVASWGESERSVRACVLPRARFLAANMAALQMTL